MEPPLLQLTDGFPGRILKLRQIPLQSLAELCAAGQQWWPANSWGPSILPQYTMQVVFKQDTQPQPRETSPSRELEIPPRLKKRWPPDEDQALTALIEAEGVPATTLQWKQLADRLPMRVKPSPRQCRARWLEFLAPGIRRDSWTPEEDELVLSMQGKIGNAWSAILAKLPGRSYPSLKNRYKAL